MDNCFNFFKLKFKILLLFFCITFSIFSNSYKNIDIKNTKNESNFTNDINITKEILEKNENSINLQIIDENIWKLEIPKIELSANISEGTEKNILDEYIGHFEETQKSNGNIGLAAHNRGYKVNYFSRLKELENGDKIYYTYNGKKSTYIVNSKTIIEDTDWSKLENTKENILTLITCVENKPKYRRCIQAIKV